MLHRLRHLQQHFSPSPSLSRKLHQSTTRRMRIFSIPIRSDNYMYLLAEGDDSPTPVGKKRAALLVDPASPKALEKIAALEGIEVDLTGVLTTHYHEDHAGGNNLIVKAIPSATIYGGRPKTGPPKVKAINKVVEDGTEITLGESIKIKCLATPCHTQDSICYYVTDGNQKAVFTGDTLFHGGCGRFFEGTPSEMHASLSYLATLPDDTVVYNGHEYTADNLKFAKTIEPDNPALSRIQSLVESNEITTGKSTIGDEKQWNVFMRVNEQTVKDATGKSDAAEVMKELRERKNAM